MNERLESPQKLAPAMSTVKSSTTQAVIQNPILPGFNPDPSILRVGDDYYIATSTFEWFPGVQIHHSRDLVNWRLVTHPLDRVSQLDMRGNTRSGGIWAPCLTYHDGLFYLVYTDVKNWGFGFGDFSNFLVTAETMEGPWSEPTYLNASGFDPSLFHDDDGRKWLVNMEWDFRPGHDHFNGILLQEFDPTTKELVGPIKNICKGSHLGISEGPHLYKRNGTYYLMLAEGGTGWDHAVSVARSSNIDGPYEFDPETPLLTSRGTSATLQKAGHASLVETQNGEWYLSHLCGRHLGNERCSLGRETAIQKVRWTDDGWLRLETGGNTPLDTVPAPRLPAHPFPSEPVRDNFDEDRLSVHYQTLRVPASDDWLKVEDGKLQIAGRQSPRCLHEQSLVARRRQAMKVRFETKVDFDPESFQQMAGLIAFYDDENYSYLSVTHHERSGKSLSLLSADKGKLSEHLEPRVSIDRDGSVILRAEFDGDDLQFSWSSDDGTTFEPIGSRLDATKLSDEYNTMELGFTGTFVGMCAHDLTGQKKTAEFHYFDCEERH